MADSFDRFTKRARHVLTLAQEEAQRLNHNYIGTEHLLLGLVQEENGVAVRVLRDLGVAPQQIRERIERTVGRGQRTMYVKVSLTPRTKRVIELAVDEARRLGHRYIGTEHLLLGLVRAGEGVAMDVLKGLGVGLDKVRSQTARIMMESSSASSLDAEKVAVGVSTTSETKATPLVDQLSIDLTALAAQGKLDPVIGREQEIERVMQILSRRLKNNPVLMGEPGVGKTAIVEGVALRIANKEAPARLLGKRVIMIDVGSLVAGTIYRGQFEERLKRVIEEIKGTKSILFIDELHMLVGAGAAGGTVDAANILKPALARGQLQCIGATTLKEYRQHIEKDAALERRFQPVMVEEPSLAATIKILKGLRSHYEAHHNVEITDEALVTAAHLADRYIADRFMPDKAIDLIDEAAARVCLYKIPFASELADEMSGPSARLDDMIGLRDSKQGLIDSFDDLDLDFEEPPFEKLKVMEEDIAAVVSMWTGIPVGRLTIKERERLLQLEETLRQRVIGQDQVIAQVTRVIKQAGLGLADSRRPLGVFLFTGPTGVGKTELALALAEALFGHQEAILRLDMSEFMEKHQVARLVGAPPGYIGYEEAGQLTEHLRRRPYSLVLLDEIEKAHADVQHLFLQLFDTGRLTDAQGRLVSGQNAVFIMTTNLGNKEAGHPMSMAGIYQERLTAAIHAHFSLEFINRINRILYFAPLDEEALVTIFEHEFRPFQGRLRAEKEIEITIAPSVKRRIAQRVAKESLGARPMRRFIEDHIISLVVDGLLLGKYEPGVQLTIDHLPELDVDHSLPHFDLNRIPDKFELPAIPASLPKRPTSPEEGLPHLDRVDNEDQMAFDEHFLALARKLLETQGITLEITSFAKNFLCAPYNQVLRGNRSPEQAFEDLIQVPLIEKLLADEFQTGDWLRVDRKFDEFVFEKVD